MSHPPDNRRRWDGRRVEEAVARGLMILSVLLVAGSLAAILLVVLCKGLPSLSLSMLTQTPRGGYYLGKEGGILNAIVGSLLLGSLATGLALLLALPTALWLRLRAPRPAARAVRFAMDLLWGVPSIVYGAFGFLVMVAMGWTASLGAAVVTVALLELPILVRAMDTALAMVPREIEEASLCLGATRLETALGPVARQASAGLLTATLLAFGRGIGDTAAVLFTAGFTDRVPCSLAEPAATLPLAIFFQLGTPFPEVQGRAYASAAVLTALVLAVSLLARLLGRRLSRHVVR